MSHKKYQEWAAQREKARAGVMIQARDLIAGGSFEEADRLVRSFDDSLEADAELARIYRECLRTAVATGAKRKNVEALFERAVKRAVHAYPEPHTEVEAEQYEQGRAEDVAVLTKIMEGASNAGAVPRVGPGGVL